MNRDLKTILTELRRRLESIYGKRLARMVLFGSRARSDAAEESDIDVLVVLHGSVHPGKEIARVGETTAAMSLEYDTVISCTFVSADRYSTERSPLLLNIRREGITV